MTSGRSKRPRYDVFLSHAHEDKAKVMWLGGLLESYWIPRIKRRRIFLDNRSLAAGSLDSSIRAALKESRYLVVCASSDAVKSRWVSREIRCFLEAHKDPDRVLICRTGKATEDDARVRRWIRRLDRVLKRQPSDWLIPDVRDGTGMDAVENALALLARILGLQGKDELLDRRSRFLARLRRGILAAVAGVALACAGASWWLRTPDGAIWNLERRLKAQADPLKFDYPAIVGPAVLALAKLGQREDAEEVARIVKGKYFHASMNLAIASGVPVPDPGEVRTLVAAAGGDVADGFPLAALLAYRVTRDPALLEVRRRFPDPADWVEALGQAGLKDEALSAFGAWKDQPDTKPEDSFPAGARLHMELGLAVPDDAVAMSAWFESMKAGKTIYPAQELLLEAAVRGRLDDPVIREVLRLGIGLARAILDDGYDPDRLAQPLAAMAGLSGMQVESAELLDRTRSATDSIRGNDAAEPLAFRALAEQARDRKSEANLLFERAVTAANEPIEATRTWGEHTRLAMALVLAERWHQALTLPPMLGSEMAQRQLEFQFLVWWQQLR